MTTFPSEPAAARTFDGKVPEIGHAVYQSAYNREGVPYLVVYTVRQIVENKILAHRLKVYENDPAPPDLWLEINKVCVDPAHLVKSWIQKLAKYYEEILPIQLSMLQAMLDDIQNNPAVLANGE